MPRSIRPEKSLEELKHEHQTLDESFESLRGRGRLTPAEELEARRLKKQKLQIKDAMMIFVQLSGG